MTVVWIALGLLAAFAAGAAAMYLWLRRDPRRAAPAMIDNLCNDTTTDDSGAVRSIQYADLYLPLNTLDDLWSPMHLEKLARTYWRFLTRVTLGVIRVVYTERERFIVLLFPALKLLTFQAPEYEMDGHRGVVRWRIERGLLVARRGRGGRGYLKIDMRRLESDRPGLGRLRIEVEVAYFYPSIAAGLGRWVYNETQSRIHVIVTYAFLRSLAKLDLHDSRVGSLTSELTPADVPDPPPAAAERIAQS
ncbi:MAG TPA: hypothetical protein VHX88_18420 [Solirubrobacteraceae bacterium]|jgi:hypothetical protein|nr:hypothetical protein [Solirubrobacteraceae bacterium]